MADMDAYDGETRGYEGNNYQTSAGTAPGQQNGYYGHSEIDIPTAHHHYDHILALLEWSHKLIFAPN